MTAYTKPLLVRLTNEQRRLMDAAAEHAGMPLTVWMRATCLKEAQRVERLAASGEPKGKVGT